MRTKHEVDVERETRATGEGTEEKFSAPSPHRPSLELLARQKKNRGKKYWWREKRKGKFKKILLLFVQIYLLFSFLFRLLVEYTEDRSDWFGEWKEWKGYVYAGSMFVAAAIQSLALHQYFQIMNTIGMRVRTAIIGLVYEKVQEKIVAFQAYY